MLSISELSFLDVQSAVTKLGGSEAVFLEVLEEYADMHDSYVNELKNALETNNMENYIIKVHSLKSSSATVGAVQMSEHAKAHEMAGKEGRYDYIRQDYDNLIEEYETLISRICSVNNVESDITEIVQKIVSDIEDYEVDDAQESLQQMVDSDIDESIKRILCDAMDKMEDFEYEEAADILRKLL